MHANLQFYLCDFAVHSTAAGIAELFSDGSFEESLAPFTADRAIMSSSKNDF